MLTELLKVMKKMAGKEITAGKSLGQMQGENIVTMMAYFQQLIN